MKSISRNKIASPCLSLILSCVFLSTAEAGGGRYRGWKFALEDETSVDELRTLCQKGKTGVRLNPKFEKTDALANQSSESMTRRIAKWTERENKLVAIFSKHNFLIPKFLSSEEYQTLRTPKAKKTFEEHIKENQAFYFPKALEYIRKELPSILEQYCKKYNDEEKMSKKLDQYIQPLQTVLQTNGNNITDNEARIVIRSTPLFLWDSDQDHGEIEKALRFKEAQEFGLAEFKRVFEKVPLINIKRLQSAWNLYSQPLWSNCNQYFEFTYIKDGREKEKSILLGFVYKAIFDALNDYLNQERTNFNKK